jgi:hypothetical protein
LVEFDHGRVVFVVGCSLFEAVGAVSVVMNDEVLEGPLELALIPDQGSVQEFMADSAHQAPAEAWTGDRAAMF